MVRVILNIGNEPVYEDYPNATDYQIIDYFALPLSMICTCCQ